MVEAVRRCSRATSSTAAADQQHRRDRTQRRTRFAERAASHCSTRSSSRARSASASRTPASTRWPASGSTIEPSEAVFLDDLGINLKPATRPRHDHDQGARRRPGDRRARAGGRLLAALIASRRCCGSRRRSAPARRGGAVHDHAVAAEVELVADARRRTARACRWPPAASHSSGMQRGDVLELLGGRRRVERPGKLDDDRVGAEPLEHRRVPAVGPHEQVAVALQVGGQAADRLLQPQVLGEVVADGGEARPDLHRVGVAPGLLGGLAGPSARDRSVVSSVKNVCSTTTSKQRPASASEFGPNATSPSGMSSSNVASRCRTG